MGIKDKKRYEKSLRERVLKKNFIKFKIKNNVKIEKTLPTLLQTLSQLTFVDEEKADGGGENTITVYLYYSEWRTQTTAPRILQLNYSRNNTYELSKYGGKRQELICKTTGVGIPGIKLFKKYLRGEIPIKFELVRDSEFVIVK